MFRRLGDMVPYPFDQPEDAPAIGAKNRAARHYADVRQCRQLALDRAEPVGPRAPDRFGEQRSANVEILFGEEDPRTGPTGGQRRAEPGRTGADDQHVAEPVDLLVSVRIRKLLGTPHPGRAADEFFIEHPGTGAAPRPDKGLVVEPGGQETRDRVVDGPEIQVQRRPAVLALGLEAVKGLDHRGPRVGFVSHTASQADQGVRLLHARREDTARPVVFEAARHKRDTVGQQRRRQGIAGVSRDLLPIETEGEHRFPVDTPAVG